jgi:cytochrome c556
VSSLKWLGAAGVAGLLIAGLFAPAWSEAPKKEEKKEKALTTERIMEDVHGEGGLRTQVAKAARLNKIEDAKKPMEDWVKLAAQLSKTKPPRGGQESWEKHCAAYEKQVKVVADAVKTEKPQAVRDALNTLARGCNACHVAHKVQ